jgi:hypothetical protein
MPTTKTAARQPLEERRREDCVTRRRIDVLIPAAHRRKPVQRRSRGNQTLLNGKAFDVRQRLCCLRVCTR